MSRKKVDQDTEVVEEVVTDEEITIDTPTDYVLTDKL